MLTNQEKLSLLEEMMELEDGSLTDKTALDDIEEWDSLAAISLIVLVDEKCGKRLTGAEIRKFETIGDILAYMG